MNFRNKEGQALLLVMLAMATLATMVLSVVSRSVSEVNVTTREDESLRAFSAAEAGVEEALIHGSQGDIVSSETPIRIEDSLDVPVSGGTNAVVSTYKADIGKYPEDLTKFNYPFELVSGQAGSVWFRTRDSDTILPCSKDNCFSGSGLTLCWGKPGVSGAETPAIVANIFYEDGSGNVVTRPVGFDPVSGPGRRDSNNFEANSGGSCTIASQNYAFSANVNFATLGIVGSPILMRVTTLYNSSTPQIFGVSTSSNLPVQGRKVTSEGTSGESVRKIDAFLLNPEIPFIFDAALYSETGLTK